MTAHSRPYLSLITARISIDGLKLVKTSSLCMSDKKGSVKLSRSTLCLRCGSQGSRGSSEAAARTPK